eukprot:1161301-Pelagomonas_calceolata.AAC.9
MACARIDPHAMLALQHLWWRRCGHLTVLACAYTDPHAPLKLTSVRACIIPGRKVLTSQGMCSH